MLARQRRRVSAHMKTKNAKPLDKTDILRLLDSKLLPGALCVQYRRCGKPNCRCARGKLHGPYYYRAWRSGGRLRWQYVKWEDAEIVRAACDANREIQGLWRA